VTRAAQVLAHGDRIVIGPGQYREAVLISERFGTPEAPLAVVGDESGKLTGDAPGAVVVEPAIFGEPALYIHRSQHVQVSGLTFRGRGVGLQVEKVRGLAIERCTQAAGVGVRGAGRLKQNLRDAATTRCHNGADPLPGLFAATLALPAPQVSSARHRPTRTDCVYLLQMSACPGPEAADRGLAR